VLELIDGQITLCRPYGYMERGTGLRCDAAL